MRSRKDYLSSHLPRVNGAPTLDGRVYHFSPLYKLARQTEPGYADTDGKKGPPPCERIPSGQRHLGRAVAPFCTIGWAIPNPINTRKWPHPRKRFPSAHWLGFTCCRTRASTSEGEQLRARQKTGRSRRSVSSKPIDTQVHTRRPLWLPSRSQRQGTDCEDPDRRGNTTSNPRGN